MPDVNTAFGLIELDDLKAELKVDETDTTFDNRLRRLINAVTQQIQTYCGRKFVAREFTNEKVDGDGTVSLLLEFPIIKVTTLTNDTITVDPTDTDVVLIYKRTGRIQLVDGSVWANKPQGITVTYRYGYEQTDLPADIRDAALTLALYRFQMRDDKRVGVGSRTHEDESYSFTVSAKGMPDDVAAALDMYRDGGF